jgi:tetratricopeptide (TPR) repeat protein
MRRGILMMMIATVLAGGFVGVWEGWDAAHGGGQRRGVVDWFKRVPGSIVDIVRDKPEPFVDPAQNPPPVKLPVRPVIKPTIKVEPMDSVLARAAVTEARLAYGEGRYAEVVDKLKAMEQRQPFPAEVAADIDQVRTACVTFLGVVDDWQQSDAVNSKNWVSITMTKGGKVEGELVRENAAGVLIETSKDQELTVPRWEIKEMKNLSQADLKSRALAEYLVRAEKASASNAKEQYELAQFCWKNGVLDHVTKHLEIVNEIDATFIQVILDDKARPLYEAWEAAKNANDEAKQKELAAIIWEKYPTSSGADMLGKRPGGKKPPPPGMFKDPQAQKLVDKANAIFDKGIDFVRESKFRDALGCFKECIALYEQVQAIEDSSWLQGRLREAGKLRVDSLRSAGPQ